MKSGGPDDSAKPPNGSVQPDLLQIEKPAESAGSQIFSIDPLPIDNREAFNLLFFNLKSHWKLPFALMLAMSACIATLGLSENSAAVVIGAMVVAPLGQPILALGASIALGWKQEMLRLFGLVLAGSVGVMAVAYLINLVLPVATPNEQVLARTAPDLRDLGIALAAGVAGAYGYYRSEFSTVLSGVAIAVALVPPLCVAGMMLEDQRFLLAEGALLLFFTNLAGIAVASLLVFFLSGTFAAPDRRKWFLGGTIATALFTLALLDPLASNYANIAQQANAQTLRYQQVQNTLRSDPATRNVTVLSITGGQLVLLLDRSLEADPELEALRQRVEGATGMEARFVSTN
ncbi:DUF389 domain-containing protein [Qipengyuania zhejiangensis]|uniref:DUF389 domain-containing protein n=1 Tax=Qipengyuania zhejiangensis TaxID=3077782 RepID=UPI002D76B43A|nr:DUF389 domain-containing protein [Qipengyuania sp. Z2]